LTADTGAAPDPVARCGFIRKPPASPAPLIEISLRDEMGSLALTECHAYGIPALSISNWRMKMGKTSNSIKDAWNASRYTQVKVSVNPEIAAAFKSACAADSVSMAKDLSGYMRKRGHCGVPGKPAPPRVATRKDRRAAVTLILRQLETIRSAEEAYMGRIPANLSASLKYVDAEAALSKLDDAIDALLEAF